MTRPAVLAATVAAALLAGCELPGMESAEKLAAARESEGKAIGAACRNGGRAIEDCFRLNLRASKSAIVAGWVEMNDYMREHKLEPVPPVLVVQASREAAPRKAESARGVEPKTAEPAGNP